jgi:hypothetical protein
MEQWQNLVDALRAELGQYGELRALFETQRRAIFSGDLARVDAYRAQIESKMEQAASARLRRVALVRNFAAEFALEGQASFRELIGTLPASARPLLSALEEEVESMSGVLQSCAHRNQALLHRAWQRANDSLLAIAPERTSQTYATPAARALKLKPEDAA